MYTLAKIITALTGGLVIPYEDFNSVVSDKDIRIDTLRSRLTHATRHRDNLNELLHKLSDECSGMEEARNSVIEEKNLWRKKYYALDSERKNLETKIDRIQNVLDSGTCHECDGEE